MSYYLFKWWRAEREGVKVGGQREREGERLRYLHSCKTFLSCLGHVS